MKTTFSSQKNPYGQKPKEQNRIKNIFKTMKSFSDKDRLVSIHNRFERFVSSTKTSSKLSSKQKYNQSLKSINKQLNKLEKEIL